jgi:DNA-directed RNA polymerase specialized sigma subunit
LILYYEWGFTEKEIGYLFGFSESRACQIKWKGESRISKALALEAQREEQCEESSEIPSEIQTLEILDGEAKEILERVHRQADNPMVQKTQSEIQETLFETFAVNAF